MSPRKNMSKGERQIRHKERMDRQKRISEEKKRVKMEKQWRKKIKKYNKMYKKLRNRPGAVLSSSEQEKVRGQYRVVNIRGKQKFECRMCAWRGNSKVQFDHHYRTIHESVKPKGSCTWYKDFTGGSSTRKIK